MTDYMTAEQVRKGGRRKPVVGFVPHGDISYYEEGDAIWITLPCLPPSKNAYSRRHWRTQHHKFFQPWYRWMAGPWMNERTGEWDAKHPHVASPCRVSVQFCYGDNRRRDAQNMFAFPPLFDALVNLGVIDDDNCAVTLLPSFVGHQHMTRIKVERYTP
jgi:hypothetical protein